MIAVSFPRIHIAMALIIVGHLIATPATRAQPPNTTYYAAIAYSQATGRYGYSSGWLSETNARRDALKNCPADDAMVVLVVGNGYAALAVGDDDSAYGYGYDLDSVDSYGSAAEAERQALEACSEHTTNCRVVVCVHSWAG